MAKKSVTKNYIYNLMYQILVMIIPLITTPYLSRVLGAKNIGIYSYTLSITTYFILFGSLGVAMYGQREIAYLQDNPKKRSITFYEILLMRFITLGISLILFYFSFCNYGQYNIYYKILILEIVANAIDISWYFQGLEEFKKTVVRNTIVKIISVICIFTLVKSSSDLNKYFIIYVLSTFLGNLTLWFYIPKYTEKISIKELKIFKHIKPTLMLFIPQIAIQLYTVLDKTMIGSLVSDKSEVGYYEQAQKIVKLLMTMATSLGTVMMPRIAHTYASGDKKKLKEYMDKSFGFILMLAFPLMFGLISISTHFVPIFYGPGYDKVSIIINVISPIIVIIGLSNVIGTQYLLPTKQQNKFTISVTTGAIVNLILNFILIRMYKSVGASIATVIAECAVTGVQLYLVRKEIKIFDIFKIAFKYIIASIVMFICSMFIGNAINNDLLSIAIQGITSVLVYFILLLLMRDKILFLILNKIFKKKKVNSVDTNIDMEIPVLDKDMVLNEFSNNELLSSLNDNYIEEDNVINNNTNIYMDDISKLIREDNSVIKDIDFNLVDEDMLDIILDETKIYNFRFNNNYFLRGNKYPKILSNSYKFMRYVIDMDINNIAYIDIYNVDSYNLKKIIDYTFRKIYFLQRDGNDITLDINGIFKGSDIINNDYFKDCLRYIR